MPPLVSMVVPVLRDTEELARLLLTEAPHPAVETIVVSGGADSPLALQRSRPDVRWLTAPRGRGVQLNHGAAHASGRWLLFLHADCRLHPTWLSVIQDADRSPALVGGSFQFRLDSRRAAARVIEWGVRQRVRWFELPYGDQAIFARRDVFTRLGGFRPLPLMEDVDLVRRLRTVGPLFHAPTPVTVSARRWERDGWARRTVENIAILVLYGAGVSPERLGRWYYRDAQ